MYMYCEIEQGFIFVFRVLEEEYGIHCNMTLLFAFAQVNNSYQIKGYMNLKILSFSILTEK